MEFSPPPSRRRARRLSAVLVVLIAGCCLETLAGTYVVKKGDTLTGIAQRHDVGVSELAKANRMSLRDVIRPGQKLTIPDGKPPLGV